jgi:hypothetical protein
VVLRTYYDVLGLKPNAEEDDIRAAYRKLSMRHHPDRSRAASAQRRFILINRAYKTLSDPDLRWEYDELLDRIQGEMNGRVARPPPATGTADRPADRGDPDGGRQAQAPVPPMTFKGTVAGMGCLSAMVLGLIAAVSVGVAKLFPRASIGLAIVVAVCGLPFLMGAFTLGRDRWMAGSSESSPSAGWVAGAFNAAVVACITVVLAGWVWSRRPPRLSEAGPATRSVETAKGPPSPFDRAFGPAAPRWADVTPVDETTVRVGNATDRPWDGWSVVLNPLPAAGAAGGDEAGEPEGGFRIPPIAGTTFPPLAPHASVEVRLGDGVNQTTGERFTHAGYKLLRVGVQVRATDGGRPRTAAIVVPVG